MRPLSFRSDELRSLLLRSKIATLEELKQALGTSVDVTVFRKLKLLDYLTSFGITAIVAHYPTGASKWNPIEHRLFSEISKHWAAEPLVRYDKMLGFIRASTKTGLVVRAYLDRKESPPASNRTTNSSQHSISSPVKYDPGGTTPSRPICEVKFCDYPKWSGPPGPPAGNSALQGGHRVS